jgi:hypothetical protein
VGWASGSSSSTITRLLTSSFSSVPINSFKFNINASSTLLRGPVLASTRSRLSDIGAVPAERLSLSGMLLTQRMFGSTMKKRRMKMNKHKLKKRRKALSMNTKISRGR